MLKWMLPVGLAAASLAPALGLVATGPVAGSAPPVALAHSLVRPAEPVVPGICPLATAMQGIDINQGNNVAILTGCPTKGCEHKDSNGKCEE
ncbi:MAG: hypothetical protein JWM18_2384 [Chloroflexi bacterium]|jgi:hypothetical protein|nr:hypothetical protein [Chloroflexota bacterium]